MGTDIHLYVETRDSGKPDAPWRFRHPPSRDGMLDKYPRTPREKDGYVSPFWGPGGCMYESPCYGVLKQIDGEWEEIECSGDDCPKCLGTRSGLRWYRQRNYDVFAMLADVRNGSGFAGIRTGEGFNVIAEPRDVPADVSEHVLHHNSWDHTPSWLTLAELRAFDWEQSTGHVGIIPMFAERFPHGETMNYQQWIEAGRGCPTSWSGGISGPGIVIVTSEEADAIIAAGEDKDPPGIYRYVQIAWTMKYSDSAASFIGFMDEFLEPLVVDGLTRADVRIVFGFDS